jgi:hypothetical protein
LPYVSGGELFERVITRAGAAPERARPGEVPGVTFQAEALRRTMPVGLVEHGRDGWVPPRVMTSFLFTSFNRNASGALLETTDRHESLLNEKSSVCLPSPPSAHLRHP